MVLFPESWCCGTWMSGADGKCSLGRRTKPSAAVQESARSDLQGLASSWQCLSDVLIKFRERRTAFPGMKGEC